MRQLLHHLIYISYLTSSITAHEDGCRETSTGFEICDYNNVITYVAGYASPGPHHLELNVNNFSDIGPKAFRGLRLLELKFSHPNPHSCTPKNIIIHQTSLDDLSVKHSLHLQCVKFAMIPRLFKNFETVETLSLENVKFIGKAEDFFAGFTGLITLKLYNVNITTISPKIFSGIHEHLQELVISGIHAIESKSFRRFHELRGLAIYNGELSDLRLDFFAGFRMLRYLDLAGNKIAVLRNYTFHKLNDLKELHLSENRISIIEPTAFSGLIDLRILNLNNNNITSLPPKVFQRLQRLELLYIAHNKIASLTAHVFNGLSNLWLLHLEYNEINRIDKNSFRKLVLTGLNLSHNNLTLLRPKTFSGLVRVDNLDLSFNNIIEIKPRTFGKLKFRQVSFCDLNVTELDVGIMDSDKEIVNTNCSTITKSDDEFSKGFVTRIFGSDYKLP